MPDIYILALRIIGTILSVCLVLGALWLALELAVGYGHHISRLAGERWEEWRKRRGHEKLRRLVRRRREAGKS